MNYSFWVLAATVTLTTAKIEDANLCKLHTKCVWNIWRGYANATAYPQYAKLQHNGSMTCKFGQAAFKPNQKCPPAPHYCSPLRSGQASVRNFRKEVAHLPGVGATEQCCEHGGGLNYTSKPAVYECYCTTKAASREGQTKKRMIFFILAISIGVALFTTCLTCELCCIKRGGCLCCSIPGRCREDPDLAAMDRKSAEEGGDAAKIYFVETDGHGENNNETCGVAILRIDEKGRLMVDVQTDDDRSWTVDLDALNAKSCWCPGWGICENFAVWMMPLAFLGFGITFLMLGLNILPDGYWEGCGGGLMNGAK